MQQVVYYTKKLMLWDYIAQGIANAAVILSLGVVLNMYTLSPETRSLAAELVIIHCAMGILIWPAAFVLPNALRAANDVKFTMIVSIASMACWRVGFSYIIGVRMGMGAIGVWIAMVVDWVCRVTCFVTRFRSGVWKEKYKA
jgi:Na+-driven multidrug efflux pump